MPWSCASHRSSPAIDADERLQKAVKQDSKGLPTAEAISLLQTRISEAREAGVREGTPNLKRALALLATLESAETAAAPEEAEKADPNKSKFDALFGGGYAEPLGIDDDLMF